MSSPQTQTDMLARIGEIDGMFEKAAGWGSWMVMCANERENLVNEINRRWNLGIEHKYQARTAHGARTD